MKLLFFIALYFHLVRVPYTMLKFNQYHVSKKKWAQKNTDK